MWLLKLSWKNLWRSRSRTAVTISAVSFAVILSVVTSSLQDGVFDHFVRNLVSYYSGYIQVHAKGYWDQQTLDNSFARDEQLENKMMRQKNVVAVAPRVESFALASIEDITKGCMVVGIDPEKENQVTFLKNKIVSGEYFSDDERGNVALLSEGLANRLKLNLNDTIILISQGYHGAMAAGRYLVSGIIKFGSPQLNDQLLYLPLSVAQQLYSAENLLTSYVLALESDSRAEETADQLRNGSEARYEFMSWKEMLPEVDQHIKTDKGSMYIVSGILYLLIGFGIFGTLLMMMAERQYELGMLLAIGMTKNKLMTMLMAESVLNVLVGCIVGIAMSFPIVYYLKVHPLRFTGNMADVYQRFGFEPIFPASTEVWIFITQAVIVLVLGLILSCYPIIKIWRMSPVIAMKK